MAKFAHYILQYIRDNLFADLAWARRQELLGQLFVRNDSIDFTQYSDNSSELHIHQVYHLTLNENIIVMRIAPDKRKEVVQNFKTKLVKNQPPCYVIIDNREGCRTIAIQRNREAYHTTETLRDVLEKTLHKAMMGEHHIGVTLHPQYYPADFYNTWRYRQYNTHAIRFLISDSSLPEAIQKKQWTEDSITGPLLTFCEEAARSGYPSVYELRKRPNENYMAVDYDSAIIRQLVNLQAVTGGGIELVTKDGERFECFIDSDEQSQKIVTSEIDKGYLDALFPDEGVTRNPEAEHQRREAEQHVLEYVNRMKEAATEVGFGGAAEESGKV